MSQPRYLFVPAEVLSAPSPERRVSWRAARGGASASGVAWRLLGGNNHELGRSIAAYRSMAEAGQAIIAFQTNIVDATAEIAASTATSRWGWRLRVDGEAIAASGRWYQREREARYNLEQFLLAAPVAQIATSLGSRSRLRPSALPDGARAEGARIASPILGLHNSNIAGATS